MGRGWQRAGGDIDMASKPVSKLKKRLMELMKAHVKRRDSYTCQKCGREVEGSNCHVSHVIPVSAGNALAFDPMNMKVLCYHCHLNWWHKNPVESGEWFRTKFSGRWEYLEEHRNDEVHWKAKDYEEMIAEAKEL
jgi:5-methylcytosine-specific restriction endonuclease McrA